MCFASRAAQATIARHDSLASEMIHCHESTDSKHEPAADEVAIVNSVVHDAKSEETNAPFTFKVRPPSSWAARNAGCCVSHRTSVGPSLAPRLLARSLRHRRLRLIPILIVIVIPILLSFCVPLDCAGGERIDGDVRASTVFVDAAQNGLFGRRSKRAKLRHTSRSDGRDTKTLRSFVAACDGLTPNGIEVYIGEVHGDDT